MRPAGRIWCAPAAVTATLLMCSGCMATTATVAQISTHANVTARSTAQVHTGGRARGAALAGEGPTMSGASGGVQALDHAATVAAQHSTLAVDAGRAVIAIRGPHGDLAASPASDGSMCRCVCLTCRAWTPSFVPWVEGRVGHDSYHAVPGGRGA